MSSLSNTTNMTIRIDKNFKKKMDTLFKNLGINTSSAIMMFLKQCEREQGIPFTATMEVPNKRLLSALEESEDIINGKVKAKRYKDFDAMIEDID
jgi:DNA-damage-inducible protein J